MMARSSFTWLVLTHCLTSVLCANFPLALDLVPHPEWHTLMRRDGPISLPNYDAHESYYYISAMIGTPAQRIRMTISTNVADLILIGSSNPGCNNNGCSEGGTYNANSSSTYRGQNQNFTFEFGTRQANGTVGTDLLTLGTQKLPDTRVLVGLASSIKVSILGIGSQILEYTQNKYLNLPAQLYSQKLTNIIGYSLYFGHFNASGAGRLLFGGVDTGKFYNKLETLPIATNDGFTNIRMSGMQVFDGVNNNTISGGEFDVLVDSASPGCYLPQAVVTQIMSKFNATPEAGGYVYDLAKVNPDTTLDLRFGSTWIRIPIYDLRYVTNATHASMALLSSFNNITTIGLPFFKNAYTVFDFTNNQISVGALNHDSSIENVTTISAAGVSGLMSTINTTTSGGSNPNTDSGNDGGLSTGQKAGIAIGVVLGVLLIIAVIAYVVFRKRRARNKQHTSPVYQTDEKPNYDPIPSKAELPAAGSKTNVVASKAELPTTVSGLYGGLPITGIDQPSEAREMDGGGNNSVYWFNREGSPPVTRNELDANGSSLRRELDANRSSLRKELDVQSSSTHNELDSRSTTTASGSGIRRKPVPTPQELPATPVVGSKLAPNS